MATISWIVCLFKPKVTPITSSMYSVSWVSCLVGPAATAKTHDGNLLHGVTNLRDFSGTSSGLF